MRAISALNAFDRATAVGLLKDELAGGPSSGDGWRSFAMLAAHIGEIGLSLEASRRVAATMPSTLERVLYYAGELAKFGREAQALAVLDTLPASVADQPAVSQSRGMLAAQTGDFATADRYLRAALAKAPLAPQSWFWLSVIKTFEPGDPDLARMQELRPQTDRAPPEAKAQFLYALAKAYDDIEDYAKAAQAYGEGAALMRGREPFDPAAWDAFARKLIADSSLESLAGLTPSGCRSDRVIFVTGLPRSGTTLVEQILASHSAVGGGAELNLLRAALIPADDYSMAGATAYQRRSAGQSDPWGRLAEDYLGMVSARFGPSGRVVDKTLNHSRFMGLLLHMLPEAKVVWLRRRAEDTALSCFRNYFPGSVPWSWSLADIAAVFKSEDRLFAHWSALFPERILPVPYEELVADPALWTGRILDHVGLPPDEATLAPHAGARSVNTASVAQVRAPISTARVGAADAYREMMAPFRSAYEAG